jgi:hypothetical protein
VALLTSSMAPRVPQAIEVVSEAEQQGLANLRGQAAPRSARRKFAFDHRENGFDLRALPILFPWKSPVHLVAEGSFRDAPARVRRDDALRSQALPNVLVVGFRVELGIRQHQADGRASSRRIHQPGQSPRVTPTALGAPAARARFAAAAPRRSAISTNNGGASSRANVVPCGG